VELHLVYEIWADQSGIRKQVQQFGGLAIKNLQNRFKQITLLNDEDLLRKELASAEKSDNERLVWYLLGQALEDKFLKPNPTLVLLDWQGLVAEFADHSQLLTALGSFLKGLYQHKEEDLFEALASYKASFENYRAAGMYPYLVSICQFCMAELHANLASITDAQACYDQALAAIRTVPQVDTRYQQIILSNRDKSAKQYQLLCECTERVPEVEWPARFKQQASLIDVDMVRMTKSWSLRHLAKKEYEIGICAGNMVDKLYAFLKQPDTFRLEMVDFLWSRSDYEHSEPILRALTQESNEAELRVKLAMCLHQLRGGAEAKEILHSVLMQNDTNAAAHSLLGQIYLFENDIPLAEKHLRMALKYDPEDVYAQNFIRLAEQRKEGIRLRQARAEQVNVAYDPSLKSLFIDPDVLESDPEQLSIQLMAAIIKGNPANANSLLESIREEKGEETYCKVMAMIEPPPQQEPGAENFERAEQFFKARRFHEAIAEYKLAIATNPQHWRAYMGLGDTYYMMGQFNLAATYFEESVQIQPTAPTYRYLGDAYMHIRNLEKAIQAYQNSVKADPSYTPAQKALQMALTRKNNRG